MHGYALEIKTYSLTEVAKMVLPPEMTDGVRCAYPVA